MVSRYDDCRRILRDAESFSAANTTLPTSATTRNELRARVARGGLPDRRKSARSHNVPDGTTPVSHKPSRATFPNLQGASTPSIAFCASRQSGQIVDVTLPHVPSPVASCEWNLIEERRLGHSEDRHKVVVCGRNDTTVVREAVDLTADFAKGRFHSGLNKLRRVSPALVA